MHRYFCTTDKSNKCNTPGFNGTGALADAGSPSWENTPSVQGAVPGEEKHSVLSTQQAG